MSSSGSSFDRKAVTSWALYDFANSSFTTLVVTFVYATFFTEVIAIDTVSGTGQWSVAVTVSAILVALISPYAGAIADRSGYRKIFLFVTTAGAIIGSVVLYYPVAGQVWFALVTFVAANLCFELANVFYNAFLPDIAPPDKIGRISGYGWALGYGGGLLCLVVALFVLVNPADPPFGLVRETGGHVRATNLLVAVWFAVFSIPMFLYVGAREVRGPRTNVFREATRQIVSTFHDIRRYRDIFRLLVARLVYNDGLVTIFAFGGIYAAGTFGFSTEEIIIFGIGLNLSAGIGAYLFGFIDDRLGGRKTILLTLIGLTASSFMAVIASSKAMLWIAGLAVGLLVGPNQSASRSLMGRFVPAAKENEFYGFFAFSGKATAFLGPLLLGRLTTIFGSQRAGVAIVMVFFVIGAALVLRVDEKQGIAAANGRG